MEILSFTVKGGLSTCEALDGKKIKKIEWKKGRKSHEWTFSLVSFQSFFCLFPDKGLLNCSVS